MFMIMLVIDDSEFLDQILNAWSDLGISGATIIESSGLHRRQKQYIPMRYAFGETSSDEIGNTTLLLIVPDEETVTNCLQAAEKIVGDFDNPQTGVFSAWPVTITKGVPVKK